MEIVSQHPKNKISMNSVDVWRESQLLASRSTRVISRRQDNNNSDEMCQIIGSLSNDDGDGNENVISKYKFTLL